MLHQNSGGFIPMRKALLSECSGYCRNELLRSSVRYWQFRARPWSAPRLQSEHQEAGQLGVGAFAGGKDSLLGKAVRRRALRALPRRKLASIQHYCQGSRSLVSLSLKFVHLRCWKVRKGGRCKLSQESMQVSRWTRYEKTV